MPAKSWYRLLIDLARNDSGKGFGNSDLRLQHLNEFRAEYDISIFSQFLFERYTISSMRYSTGIACEEIPCSDSDKPWFSYLQLCYSIFLEDASKIQITFAFNVSRDRLVSEVTSFRGNLPRYQEIKNENPLAKGYGFCRKGRLLNLYRFVA